MLEIRRSRVRLIFNMRILIPEKDGLYTGTGPWWQASPGARKSTGTVMAVPSHHQIRSSETNVSYCILVENALDYFQSDSHFSHVPLSYLLKDEGIPDRGNDMSRLTSTKSHANVFCGSSLGLVQHRLCAKPSPALIMGQLNYT